MVVSRLVAAAVLGAAVAAPSASASSSYPCDISWESGGTKRIECAGQRPIVIRGMCEYRSWTDPRTGFQWSWVECAGIVVNRCLGGLPLYEECDAVNRELANKL